MDVFSFADYDDESVFRNDHFAEFEKSIEPLEDVPSKPKRTHDDTLVVSKRLKMLPFPPMEEYVCPATQAYNVEMAATKRSLQQKDRRASKNVFVRKEFLQRLIRESEAKTNEIKRLTANNRKMNEFWDRQSELALPRIAAVNSLIATQSDLLQGVHNKTTTVQEAADALKDLITPMLPTDVARNVQKLVQVLGKSKVNINLRFTATGAVLTFRTQMSSKSPTSTSSVMAASTSSFIASSSSSSWKYGIQAASAEL